MGNFQLGNSSLVARTNYFLRTEIKKAPIGRLFVSPNIMIFELGGDVTGQDPSNLNRVGQKYLVLGR